MYPIEMPAASDILSINNTVFDLRQAFADALSPAGRPDDDEEENEEETDDEEEEETGEAPADNPEAQKHSRDAAKQRSRAKAEKKRADELAAKLKALEDAGETDEAKKLAKRVEDAEQKSADAASDRNEAIMRAALAQAQLDHGKFKDPEYIDYLLKREDDIEVDEDGEIDGLDDWVKDLAKEKPELFVSASGDEEDGEGDEEGKDQQSKSNSGKPRTKKKKGQLDEQAIKKKFPALVNR